MSRPHKYGAGRYPRSLQALALEYTRIRIWRARDMMYMKTYCHDVRTELGRCAKYRKQYHRQQKEILRLRLVVRSLREHRANVVRLRLQNEQLAVQKRRLETVERELREKRRSRCQMYRDWRDTHSRCSKLVSENKLLQAEVDELRKSSVSIMKELSRFTNDLTEMQTHFLNRINTLSKSL